MVLSKAGVCSHRRHLPTHFLGTLSNARQGLSSQVHSEITFSRVTGERPVVKASNGLFPLYCTFHYFTQVITRVLLDTGVDLVFWDDAFSWSPSSVTAHTCLKPVPGSCTASCPLNVGVLRALCLLLFSVLSGLLPFASPEPFSCSL